MAQSGSECECEVAPAMWRQDLAFKAEVRLGKNTASFLIVSDSSEIQNDWLPYGSLGATDHGPYRSQSIMGPIIDSLIFSFIGNFRMCHQDAGD